MSQPRAGQSSKIYINDFGLINALGSSLHEISANLFAGSQQGFVARDDILPDGTTIYVAQVSSELPSVAQYPEHFHSRNNQLALQAYEQIAASGRWQANNKGASFRSTTIIGCKKCQMWPNL